MFSIWNLLGFNKEAHPTLAKIVWVIALVLIVIFITVIGSMK